MELDETLRSTPAIRRFTSEPIEDETIAEILDVARFAPSGGNRQGWHVIVLKDPEIRSRVRDLYVTGWHAYQRTIAAQLAPYAPGGSPSTDDAARERARGQQSDGLDEFATGLAELPALLLVLADLGCFAMVDQDLDRYSFAGGASIYPFCWNILLAARSRGIGGVMTTMSVVEEAAMRELLEIPDDFAIATLLVMGRPVGWPTTLRRLGVEQFTSTDRFGERPLHRP